MRWLVHRRMGSIRTNERFTMNKFARIVRKPRNLLAVPAALLAGVVGSPAFAAIDVASATSGISDAQTAVLAVLAVMITMAAAIFGVKKVLSLIGK